MVAFVAADLAHAAPIFPPYIVGVGRKMHIYSNDEWSLKDVGGRRAKETKAATGQSTSGSDPAFWVWKPRCRTGKQTTRVVRRVELPGPPGNLRFSIAADRFAIGRVDLLFNGQLVLRVPDLALNEPSFELDATARAALRAGTNEIEVVVVKIASPSCTGFSGVFFGLDGDFKADMRVGVQAGVKYRHGRRVLMINKLLNLGPSKVFSAHWEFSLNTGFPLGGGRYVKEIGEAVADGPGGASLCQIRPPDAQSGFYRAICDFGDFEPNTSVKIYITINFTPEYLPFDYESATYFWRVTVPGDQASDPNIGNNLATGAVIFCDTPSSLAGCQESEN